ncbi:MAG: hypothetical protein L6413_05860, partial [Coriobacteriia bacterium]|nr:hypothetical protein [Coriobacteriia bacterium]
LWAPPFNAGLLKIVDFITQPGVFIRRKALCEPMLDEAYHFALDYELWLRLAATGKRFARIPRIVGIDRHQPGRKSLTMLDVHAENTQRLVEGYGAVGADAQVGRRSRFYLQQRIAGAAWIGRARVDLAFATPPNPRKGLLRRQIFSRRSSWPTEYR